MSTSGLQLQFLFIRLITYISHLYKLRHRKELLENFRKFISQERHIRILIKGAHCFFFEDLRKKRKLTFMIFNKILILKAIRKKDCKYRQRGS